MERIFDQENREASNYLLRYIVIGILFLHNLERSKNSTYENTLEKPKKYLF